MGVLNLVVMGKTGVGKSTLINAVLGKTAAPVGKGQAVTKENYMYHEMLFLPVGSQQPDGSYKKKATYTRLYDTVGLELDQKKTKATLEGIRDFIQGARYIERRNDMMLVWFCVNYNSSRFEAYELNLIRMLSYDYEIPFIIVLTQCTSAEKGELEMQIERKLPGVPIARVLAQDYKLRGGAKIPAFGLTELIRASVLDYESRKIQILESKLKSVIQNKNQLVSEMKAEGESCIKRYEKTASKIGYVPVGCIPIIHGICIKMIVDLHKIFKISLKNSSIKEVVGDVIIGAITTPFMAVPVFSSFMASSYVRTVGEYYLKVLVAVVEISTSDDLQDNVLMERRIRDELKRHGK